MFVVQWLMLLSAAFGLAGSALLFAYSYSLIPPMGFLPSAEDNAEIQRTNRRWRLRQRLGFGLLCASFAVEVVAVFWS